MRIDAYNKISQLYQPIAKKTAASEKAKEKERDKLEISQMGRDYHIAKQAVANAPDVRLDKVNKIREKMASGTYDISSREIANKMIDSILEETI